MAQSEQQKALLKNNLQVPLIVRDLLITGQCPSDETIYGLHDIMGSYQPDMAVLTCAFVMKEIASLEMISTSDLAFLNLECERLIERYSARDDLAQDNPEMWEESQPDMMCDIAEDLEGFLDLLSLCKLSFEITAPHIAHILNIMDVQLQCQLMIVDEVIEKLAQQTQPTPPQSQNGYAADNVIMFPGNA